MLELLDSSAVEDEMEHESESVIKMSTRSEASRADRLRNLRKSLAHVKAGTPEMNEQEQQLQLPEEEEEEEEDIEGEEEGKKREEEEEAEEGNAEDDDEEEEEKQVGRIAGSSPVREGPAGNSLQEMQRIYGVEPDENLVRDWEAYRSHLVDMVYEESSGVL